MLTSVNSDYKLTKASINMKPTPVTAARLEVFEEVPTLKLPELDRGAKSKKLHSVELKLAPYKDS